MRKAIFLSLLITFLFGIEMFAEGRQPTTMQYFDGLRNTWTIVRIDADGDGEYDWIQIYLNGYSIMGGPLLPTDDLSDPVGGIPNPGDHEIGPNSYFDENCDGMGNVELKLDFLNTNTGIVTCSILKGCTDTIRFDIPPFLPSSIEFDSIVKEFIQTDTEIRISGKNLFHSVTVHSINGELVFSENPNKNDQVIDISSYISGTYIISIKDDAGKKGVKKFIIIK